ncbi:hypothetical protein APHAL10511_007574 [Amanita phalloides]|nr:hypothetical protein APHAL10511_007574 [Amanita phalloides]
MPSFLSKVFGRKKQDDKDDSAPLGGPYENISPTVSPSASNFPDSVTSSVVKEKDSGFPLFKNKFRAAATESHQKPDVAPHLALNLPSSLSRQEDSPTRALDVVFEADFDARFLLDDAVIGERRLSPTETLVLLRICTRSIASRGLETLGIMHPHWYSSSHDVQRKLISLYIHSLAAKSTSTTLSPSSAILSTFESEIEYVRSPHDVAAVLRWALRHLKLDGNCFGREHGWYRAFFDEERGANYPPKAFSDYLSPRVPTSHSDLLYATFEIFSSLAAHAEANGISGSKLAKYFGLWLLDARRVEETDNWSTFYARWERTGRMLEHLFLAWLRGEAINHRMPVRLMELVKKYPYGAPTDNDLLSRPRFSTRQYEAMLIRVETHLTTQRKLKHSHNKLISDAFEAEILASEQEYKELWEQIKVRRSGSGSETPPSDCPDISRIFADETVRFLSLLPDENSTAGPTSYSLFKKSNRKRSLSMNDQDLPVASPSANSNGTAWHAKISTDSAQATTITPINRSGTRDWTQFSTSGFAESGTLGKRLAATLLDNDVEIVVPGNSSANKHSRFATSPSVHKSMEFSSGPIATSPKEEAPLASSVKVVQFSSVRLDEAFVDFWGDALTDPISANWPPFVLCKLKPDFAGTTKSGKKVDWLVIERTFVKPAILDPQSPDALSEGGGRRPTSPRPSIASQGTFSSAKKRFSLFNTSGSRTSLDKRFGVPSRKKANSLSKTLVKNPSAVRVGEMGEVLREEDEKETTKASSPSPKPRKSTQVEHKSQEPTKSVDAKDEPVPLFPTPEEDNVNVPSPTQRTTEAELATAGVASAAAIAMGVASSFDFSQVDRVPEVQQDRTSSPPVTSQLKPPAVAETAPLETVVEVADESITLPVSSMKYQPVAEVMEEEMSQAASEPTVVHAASTAVEVTSADEPAPVVKDDGMFDTDTSVESEPIQSAGEPEAAVEVEVADIAAIAKEHVAEATPAEEGSKAPSEPPPDDLA